MKMKLLESLFKTVTFPKDSDDASGSTKHVFFNSETRTTVVKEGTPIPHHCAHSRQEISPLPSE